jgi:hypothetical protein
MLLIAAGAGRPPATTVRASIQPPHCTPPCSFSSRPPWMTVMAPPHRSKSRVRRNPKLPEWGNRLGMAASPCGSNLTRSMGSTPCPICGREAAHKLGHPRWSAHRWGSTERKFLQTKTMMRVRRHVISGPSEYNKNSGMINTGADRIQFQILEAKRNSASYQWEKYFTRRGDTHTKSTLYPCSTALNAAALDWFCLHQYQPKGEPEKSQGGRCLQRSDRQCVQKQAASAWGADLHCRQGDEYNVAQQRRAKDTTPHIGDVPIQAATGNWESCRRLVATQGGPPRAPNPAQSGSARAAHGGDDEALCFSHYSILSVMEFGDFFLVWLNKGRTEESCDKQ